MWYEITETIFQQLIIYVQLTPLFLVQISATPSALGYNYSFVKVSYMFCCLYCAVGWAIRRDLARKQNQARVTHLVHKTGK